MRRKKKTMDGNSAAAYVSYAYTDVASIYPITPSSVMSDEVDKYSSSGRKNLFGRCVKVTEMQSEAGAAGAMHGALSVGALATTYTASQGLLLMIPNMYKIAGELLPNVIHVSARTIASHALSIFGDHSDVYSCRQTGYAMLCSNSPQEVMDLSVAAHLSAIKGRVPFLHFFDGFRTSHEVQKIDVWDYDELSDMLDWQAVQRFKNRSLSPENPQLRGTAQNDDIFFQSREACNKFYDEVPNIVVNYMNEINRRIGSDYKPFNYYGDPEAENIIIAMGSVCETAEEVVDYLRDNGEKVGLVKVRLYRPFSAKHLFSVIPKSVKSISVLDRTKEPGSIGEPLYLDVLAAVSEYTSGGLKIYAGRYGLSSKDTTPGQIIAVYRNMESDSPKRRFTIGINDDVTYLSLCDDENPDTIPEGTYSCKFWGLGSDGTVGANKNSIKIIGDNTDMYVQGYFAYDSKKSGGVTVSHLRFGDKPIKSTYYVNQGDFIACHNPSYINKYDMINDLKKGGSFLLNCSWSDEELDGKLPDAMKLYIAQNNIKFYTIDGINIGKEIGLGGRINTILQAAFFSIVKIMPIDKAVEFMKDAAYKTYIKKGEKVVTMNYGAIEMGVSEVHQVNIPKDWSHIKTETKGVDLYSGNPEITKYVRNILEPVNSRKGNELPVSSFMPYADGTVPQGSAAYEKRGIAIDIPKWIPENCIQCNFCSFVCPHAVIRPAVMTKEEKQLSPEGTKSKKMTGFPDLEFAVTISALDCTGCGNCAQVCPGMRGNKALVMEPAYTQIGSQEVFDYVKSLPQKPDIFNKFKEYSVKGSQFKRPLLEFSGACAGCGETPYAKLATQLFGDRMYIANATGCSSIWGGSAPSTPYTMNSRGRGPAWQNSLFEDNAEFGYGILLAHDTLRLQLIDYVKEIDEKSTDPSIKDACKRYIETLNDSQKNVSTSDNLLSILQEKGPLDDNIKDLGIRVITNKKYLSKKSVWLFGGDGWAYDIGFGGLDHVISSGEDINILVFDTEIYSNTGGQASKATPIGSVAQFASSGKSIKKKDLAAIAMTYGYVYVAQVAMGADYNQCIKAFAEAESYKGPSIIIAYAPCINHGIKGGMGMAKLEEKKAVECGYWNLLRYDPRRKENGENPFVLDSKAPKGKYRDFIMNEIRYSSLQRSFPERADELFGKAEKSALEKFEDLKQLSENKDKSDK